MVQIKSNTCNDLGNFIIERILKDKDIPHLFFSFDPRNESSIILGYL